MTVFESTARGWDPSDLVRRLLQALQVTGTALTIAGLDPSGRERAEDDASGASGLKSIAGKVVAEAAMLLYAAAPVKHVDGRVGEATDALAARIAPHARSEGVLAAICLDPGLAVDHAVAHILLSALGHVDSAVDDLLAASLAMGPAFGPERLAHRRLERAWLARIWPRVWPTEGSLIEDGVAPGAVAESSLGRPLDALGATRFDVYAFTHAAMYASDLGARAVRLARRPDEIAADAVAALALGVLTNDHDLTAEILLTSPLLGWSWGAEAAFAFAWLAGVQDQLGFLPGSSFEPARHGALSGDSANVYAISTSYHTTIVMGLLCAALLRAKPDRPTEAPSAGGDEQLARALLARLPAQAQAPLWRRKLDEFATGALRGLVPLLLAMVLRDARTRGDLVSLRDALALAAGAGATDGAAPSQAAALLRRSAVLDRALEARRR
jgi:hypothetical protein